MKNFYLVTAAVLIILMLTLPLLSLAPEKTDTPLVTPPPVEVSDQITVLNSKTGQTEKMNMRDYLFGVVAAEISLSSEPETIKAQSVAAYTYALYKTEKNKKEKYDITTDSSVDQAYLTKAEISEKWGDKAAEYEKKLNDCLNATEGIYISYDNKPIFAAYHAISSGKTESCETVWGNKLPYLVETESMGDLLSPDYLTEQKISVDDFKAAFSEICTLPQNAAEFIGKITRSSSGGVKTIAVGNKTLTGGEFRKALKLRSANFDVRLSDNTFVFTVRGYGHGVGMSQCGAEYMAKQGSTFSEILAWYYKGCALKTK